PCFRGRQTTPCRDTGRTGGYHFFLFGWVDESAVVDGNPSSAVDVSEPRIPVAAERFGSGARLARYEPPAPEVNRRLLTSGAKVRCARRLGKGGSDVGGKAETFRRNLVGN